MGTFLARFSISTKIATAVIWLALTAGLIGGIGFLGMETYDARVDDIQNSSQRALLGEQINGLVLKVVMESRGIYASKSKAEIETFAKSVWKSTELITLDPLSAVLDLLFAVGAREGCDRALPVFDGRRRYDMLFSEVGRRIVDPSRYSVFAGVAQQCRVTYRPVAGYARSSPAGRFWQRSGPADRPPVDLWLAPVAAGYPPLPVRLETDSDFGGVVVHLTGVTPPAADRRAGAMPPPAR